MCGLQDLWDFFDLRWAVSESREAISRGLVLQTLTAFDLLQLFSVSRLRLKGQKPQVYKTGAKTWPREVHYGKWTLIIAGSAWNLLVWSLWRYTLHILFFLWKSLCLQGRPEMWTYRCQSFQIWEDRGPTGLSNWCGWLSKRRMIIRWTLFLIIIFY